MDLIGLISSIAGIGIALSALEAAFRAFVRKQKSDQGETIEDRVGRLTRSLQEATTLIANIEAEIKARSSLATQLQQDIDRYNQLVEIRKPEVEAIAQLLRGELKHEGRSSFWKSVLLNFVFFVLGAGASLLIAKLIR